MKNLDWSLFHPKVNYFNPPCSLKRSSCFLCSYSTDCKCLRQLKKTPKKTLLLSPVLQEEDYIFVLQTEITLILDFLENKASLITVLILQATLSNNS